jgi:quinol monooxygenase YgiN
MYIVFVHVHVKPEFVDDFRAATLDNAANSRQEPGVARFDVVQEMEDPTKFVLVEVYRTPEGANQHKLTPHYARWRDAVAEMMASPRVGIKYSNVSPDDTGW